MQPDIRDARSLFPATRKLAYFNTAAVALGSAALGEALRAYVSAWVDDGPGYVQAEAAGERCRAIVAGLIGAAPRDVALIPSVSAAAGLIAAQFGPVERGASIVIGEREYSSNHFPWRQLAQRGYDVRQVGFRNGGLEPADIAAAVDAGTKLIAFSAVQTATGHRSDIAAIGTIARRVGACTFVDGSQWVGAMPVAAQLDAIDILATSDHKFLLNAGRGVGYCYIRHDVQKMLLPFNAGWKAGANPMETFFGPAMPLSQTASRFDNSLAWLAAIGDEAALGTFTHFGAETIYRRNAELAAQLRAALAEAGHPAIDLPEANRSTIVALKVDGEEPAALVARLKADGIVAAARDGNLRLSVHLYNHEDDIARLAQALRRR
jgi:selenocysteine lyase/cysteine desulfurase